MDIFVAIFTFYLEFGLVMLKNNYLANFKVEAAMAQTHVALCTGPAHSASAGHLSGLNCFAIFKVAVTSPACATARSRKGGCFVLELRPWKNTTQ